MSTLCLAGVMDDFDDLFSCSSLRDVNGMVDFLMTTDITSVAFLPTAYHFLHSDIARFPVAWYS